LPLPTEVPQLEHLEVNTGLFSPLQHVTPTQVIVQSPSIHNVMKFIDLIRMTGFLKQNGSRFTMMNDQEAKCAAIVFPVYCIGSPVSWVSSFYWWTHFKRHWWVGYPL